MVFAFGLDDRTIRNWEQRAGHHSAQVHQHLVQRPRDLGQVQADEIRVKMQKVVVWLAMAMQVSTRLWLGATLSEHRDETLLTALMQRVRACALCRPLLFGVDGFRAYRGAIHTIFREPIPTHPMGRPPLRPGDGIYIAQVVKQYAHGYGIDVARRIVQGTEAQVNHLVRMTQGDGVINTAYYRASECHVSVTLGRSRSTRAQSFATNTDAPGRGLSGWNDLQFLYISRKFAPAFVCRSCRSQALGVTHPRHGRWNHRSSLVGL
jgi:transposase-like protein